MGWGVQLLIGSETCLALDHLIDGPQDLSCIFVMKR
jgi:hypothetical protein